MAGFFRKAEQKIQFHKVEGGKLRKEEVLRFEENDGNRHKEEVVKYEEDILDGNDAEVGYPNQLKKIKQKVYKKKEKVNGRKGAGGQRDDSSSDSD